MEEIIKDKELLEELGRHSLTAYYPAGTRINGKDLRAIPIILSGVIKVVKTDTEDNKLLLYYVNKNETCVLSLLQGALGKDRTIAAHVEEDAEIMFVPVEKAVIWMQTYPEWTEFVLQSYYKRFDELLQALSSVSAEKLETRVIKYLRQRRKIGGNKVINITHQHMASDLATNRVVISRLLKTLENKGFVKLGRNKIEVTEVV